jgi:hypothetical protein
MIGFSHHRCCCPSSSEILGQGASLYGRPPRCKVSNKGSSAGRVRSCMRPVGAAHVPRPDALGDEPVQLAGNPHARERRVGHQRQAFARAVVDDRKDAEATPVGELVRHEVKRPTFVGAQRHEASAPRSRSPACARHAGERAADRRSPARGRAGPLGLRVDAGGDAVDGKKAPGRRMV